MRQMQRMAPCLAHLFGTDETGMDIFSRCIWAIRIDVVIGVFGTLISLMIGIPFGLFAGYYEGIIGEVILRIADLIQAFPAFILQALVSAAWKQYAKYIDGGCICKCTYLYEICKGRSACYEEQTVY